MPRCSVKHWTEEALLAASVRIASFKRVDAIVIDLIAQDGNTFARGRVGADMAKELRDGLNAAIAELAGPDT